MMESKKRPIVVTGSAGFIGMHVSKRLLEQGEVIIGIDNLNDYYDVTLKIERIKNLSTSSNFTFIKADISNKNEVFEIFSEYHPKWVINLAAQAGVRYSIKNPYAYIDSNIVGFINILEACRNFEVEHLVYASSSSVYGGNTVLPFSENDNVDQPLSLYAATKKSNELMAHCYSHLYQIPTTGLRFFTVYGPWGRPDMALFLFTKAILSNTPIDVYNNGNMIRDFTYIDDVVEGILRVLRKPPIIDTNSNIKLPYKIFNIGNNNPSKLLDYIKAIERELGKESIKNYLSMQDGDVPITQANTDNLFLWTGFKPKTTINEGVKNFINWYTEYYK